MRIFSLSKNAKVSVKKFRRLYRTHLRKQVTLYMNAAVGLLTTNAHPAGANYRSERSVNAFQKCHITTLRDSSSSSMYKISDNIYLALHLFHLKISLHSLNRIPCPTISQHLQTLNASGGPQRHAQQPDSIPGWYGGHRRTLGNRAASFCLVALPSLGCCLVLMVQDGAPQHLLCEQEGGGRREELALLLKDTTWALHSSLPTTAIGENLVPWPRPTARGNEKATLFLEHHESWPRRERELVLENNCHAPPPHPSSSAKMPLFYKVP